MIFELNLASYLKHRKKKNYIMKKSTFVLVIAIILSTTAFAQDMGKIVIRNGNKAYPNFIASLNGIRLTNDYAPMMAFNLLDETTYRLKLLQAGSTSILTYTLNSEPRYLSKYVITKDNVGNYTIILESKSLMLDEETPVGTPTTVTQTTVVITKTVAVTPTVAPTSTLGSTAVTITPISKADFDDRLNAIKNTSFDDQRLAKAKQVFDDEYLTTNQVIEVVKVFSFDDSKLDFAKWAYKKTMDKKNYYKVEDQFSFSGTKTNLANYVKSQPK